MLIFFLVKYIYTNRMSISYIFVIFINISLKQLENLGNLLSWTYNANTVGNFTTQMQELSVAQQIAILNSKNLDAAQRQALASALGLTIAEDGQTISTASLSASEGAATLATGGLGTAFKGLGASIAASTMEMYTFLTTTPIGWAILAATAVAGVAIAYSAFTVSLEEQKEKLKEAKEDYTEVTKELSQMVSQIQDVEKNIKELEAIPNLTWVQQEELDRLREVTKELELQKDLKQKEQINASQNLYNENLKTYEKEFTNSAGTTSIDDLTTGLSKGQYALGQLNPKHSIVDLIASLQYLEEKKEALTDPDEIDEFEETIKDYTNLLEENGASYLSSLSAYKQNILEISGIRALTENEQAFYDSLETMQKAIYEFYSPATWNNLELDSIFKTEGIEKSREEIYEMFKAGTLTEEALKNCPVLMQKIKDADFLGTSASNTQAFCDEINAAAEQIDDFVYAAKSGAKSYEELLKSAEAGSDAFSAVKKAVSSVNDAFSEQAENGSVSVDTMLSLVSEGYATALSFDTVTGACTLNRDAMMELVQTKIQNQIEDLKILNTNIKAKLLEDGISASTSAQGFYDLIEAKEAYASNDVITSMKNYNDATARIKALENGLKNINKIGSGSYSTSAKASSSAAKKAESDWKKFLDEELNLARAEFDAGLTDFNTYLSKRKDILDKYLAETKISYDDYWDYIKKGYEEQKKYYDNVLSAVTNRLDQEIDSNQAIIDGIEKENDVLEEQKDHYDNIISAVLDTIGAKNEEIQSSIDVLEKENDEISKQVDEYDSVISAVQKVYEAKQEELGAEQDAIQERIDALREENDEQKRATELQKARYELERSMNQRSRMVYNGDQFVYMADSQTVRDNREKLENLELENTIASMEKEKEALQQLIDELDRYKNMWAEIADSYQKAKDADIAGNILGENYEEEILQNRIEDIEAFRDRYMEAQANIDDNNGMITSYEEKLAYYDSLKEKWSQLSTLHEENINKQLANELFGSGWESLILEDRLSGFDEFKNSYLDIQNRLDDNTGLIESYNEKISYYQKLKNEWGAVADVYEDSVRAQHAAMMWGQNWEADILSGRITNLNQFKNDYAEIQKTLAQIDIDRYNTQVKAAKNAEKQTYTSDASINSGADITGNYSGVISGGKDDSFEDIIHYRIVDSKTGKMYIDGIESRQTADQWIGKQEESGRYTGSIIGRMKVEKYARGGVVRDTASDLDDWIAQVCREDRIVAVSANERVLTEDQNRGFEKLVAMIPSLMADRYLPGRTPGFDIRELNQIQNTRPVSFSTGDIILNNVQNVDGLAKAIELSFPHAMMRRMQQR